MELNYKYVTVRCYKPHKGYTDETHIKDVVDCVYKVGLTEEENIAFFEKEYMEVYAPDLNCEVVGSISSVYKGKEVADDPIADSKIEAELLESTSL
tara:strand:- start:8447 stop:8734 length:288 start_codon:yes stop_codon:yes gene_type:complete